MKATGRDSKEAKSTPLLIKRPEGHAHQIRPGALQLKNAVSAQSEKRPVAPPIYRPSAKPLVAQSKTNPTAPRVYRPQPLPKVLQKKVRDTPQSRNTEPRHPPVAPAAYRPQLVPRVLQMNRPEGNFPLRPSEKGGRFAQPLTPHAAQMQTGRRRPPALPYKRSLVVQRSEESATDKFKRFKKESLTISKEAHDKATDLFDPTVKNLNKVKSKMYTIDETEIVAADSFRNLMAAWADENDSNKEAWTEYGKATKAYRAEQERLKSEDEAKKPKKKTYSKACEDVFDDMERQFTAWDGTHQNRGAYWGATGPGVDTGAKNVASEVVQELKKRVHQTGWVFSNSDSGGLSFHRIRPNNSETFIYHMQSP